MGIFKFLRNLGNAESTREAIRLSYDNHARELLISAPTTDPHAKALWGVLATRYQIRGELKGEIETWSDLTPFLGMDRTIAVEALAEYIVLLERPREANLQWLGSAIKLGIQVPGPHMRFGFLAYLNKPPWTMFLTEEDLQRMMELSRQFDDVEDDEDDDDDEEEEDDDEIEDD